MVGGVFSKMRKNWYDYKVTLTRKEYLQDAWIFSIPIVSWVGLFLAMIFKPHKKNGRWK